MKIRTYSIIHMYYNLKFISINFGRIFNEPYNYK